MGHLSTVIVTVTYDSTNCNSCLTVSSGTVQYMGFSSKSARDETSRLERDVSSEAVLPSGV